jgi:Fur family peroxide stress response transcriptional regulator
MKNMRYSHQREQIYQALTCRYDHPTAETLYQALRPQNPSLSLGTVYRNLNQLAERGMVQRMPFTPDRYDANVAEHPHFFCTQCGALYDLPLSTGQNLTQEVASLGFQVQRQEVYFRGICKDCLCSRSAADETP